MSWRRRWPWILGGLVGLLAVVAAIVWYAVLPRWRPSLRDGERYGIDVSNHQGAIDWDAVAADDIDFAYIKATEGGDSTDRRFALNWRGAGEAGLDSGAYHFFTLCRPGRDQARHFLSVAEPDPSALPPAIDLELAGNCSDRPPVASVQREVGAFVDIVESAWDMPVLVYVRDDWEDRYPVRDELARPLWHFRFFRRPNVDNWLVWQIHYRAEVDGISGGVDLNIMRSTATARSRRMPTPP